MSGTVESLRAAFDTSNAWAGWGTLVVIIGVAVDFLVLLVFSKEMNRTEKALLAAANILIVAGCGAEYWFGGKASDIASELQRRSDEHIAQLGADAEAARSQITTAAAQANKARADAAAANERAAEVEEAARWRSVPADAQARLISELAAGPGGNVVLAYAGNDPEAVFLASRYDLIFREANQRAGTALWNIEIQPRVYSHGVFFGLRVLGPPDAATAFMRSAFTGAGIDFNTDAIPPVLNDSPGMTIGIGSPVVPLIFVGPKWQPH